MAESVSMMKKKRRILLFCSIIGICAIFAFSFGAYADIYKWVDEKGVTHFTDSPPPDKEAEKLQERPVEKMGGTEAITLQGGETYSDNYSQNRTYLEETIRYYETEINNCERDIRDYQRQIKELEKKIWDLPSHYSSHSAADSSDRLKKSYESSIEQYKSRIEDKKNQSYEYTSKIDDLKKELSELRFKESFTKEQKPIMAIVYHGDVEKHVFHRPECKLYNCANCTAFFYIREEALRVGYKPCEVCNP